MVFCRLIIHDDRGATTIIVIATVAIIICVRGLLVPE
jgi:hypothetical protein